MVYHPIFDRLKEIEFPFGFCGSKCSDDGMSVDYMMKNSGEFGGVSIKPEEAWEVNHKGYKHFTDLNFRSLKWILSTDRNRLQGVHEIEINTIDGKDPFYAYVTGIVTKPYRLKLFSGNRYFISNKDGSQYYYCL